LAAESSDDAERESANAKLVGNWYTQYTGSKSGVTFSVSRELHIIAGLAFSGSTTISGFANPATEFVVDGVKRYGNGHWEGGASTSGGHWKWVGRNRYVIASQGTSQKKGDLSWVQIPSSGPDDYWVLNGNKLVSSLGEVYVRR
jgi:hypothetical protein